MPSTEEYLMQNLGELKEAVKGIQKTNENIESNLKVLNDQNILHGTAQKQILREIQLLTGKYWWLIVALLIALLVSLGFKEALTIFKP
jgi:hypothetical protein